MGESYHHAAELSSLLSFPCYHSALTEPRYTVAEAAEILGYSI